jgi:CheY-like chemotaxis protein
VLEYEAPADGGAEFKVMLPLFESEIPADPSQVAPQNGRPPRRRILVVDEDPSVHRLLSALFAHDGHAVEAVRSGEQGLKLAREHEFDLIITDAGLPAGPAQLFAGALLEECPRLSGRLVVACSGEADLPAPLAQQPVHRVRKPFNLRDLRTIANDILQ